MIPPKIFVPTTTGLDISRQWFASALDSQPDIQVIREEGQGNAPDFRRHLAAMNMAFQNAREDIIRRVRERGDMPAMEELQKLLNLSHLPVRIEGFDIAHIGGRLPVASLISFYNGNPDKKNYRYFRLKTTDGIIDDFASMREAVARRYTRLLNEQADLPDLILIDGGIGQVNAVQAVLSALQLDIPVAGLAKRDEEIYRPGNSTPIRLPKRSEALRLLQRVRDETHRFATSRNQRLRTKENTVSVFAAMPHVGDKRARSLMLTFTSPQQLVADCKAYLAEAQSTMSATGREVYEAAPIAALLHIPRNQAEDILAACKEYLAQLQEATTKLKSGLQNGGKTSTEDLAAQLFDEYDFDHQSESLAAEEEIEYGEDD